MGLCSRGSIEVAPFQDLIKHLGSISPGFFSQIVPETHVLSTLDHILYDPFPEIVRQCYPIYLYLSVPFPKRICLWCPDKDKVALFGRQHHIIPIDHKHVTSMITEQIGCMQIRMTDDVWEDSRLEHLCQLFQGGHDLVNRGLMGLPRGEKSAFRDTTILSRMQVLGLKGTYPSGIYCRIKGFFSK